MKKQIEITVPKDWSAVTFRQYLSLQKDIENYKDEELGYDITVLYHLCGLTPEVITKLDVKVLESIRNDVYKFLNTAEGYELQRTIKIGDKLYGIEPNLSEMPYGAYLDISKHDSIMLDEKWPEILSIIYREVDDKKGSLYDIKSYKGVSKEDSEKWWDVTMDFHFGCFFFFTRLYLDLVSSILNYSANLMEKYPNIKSILLESGKDIQQLWNYPTEILPDLKK